MSPTFRSLANPNYRRYAMGSVVSNTGTWMQRVAQDWLVLQLTSSGTALGITMGLQFLPVLLLSPYAGVIADRVPKRRLLQVTQAAMAVSSLLLAGLSISGVVELWMVYGLVLVFGVASAFDGPARQSFVSEMVTGEDLPNAVGLNSASFNAARIVGPGLAGLMIAALGGDARATGWVILLNALSYGAVIWQLERMDVALLHSPELRGKGRGAMREGVRYLRSQPRLVMVLIMIAVAGTFGLNFQITSALMATDAYGKGADGFGVLGSSIAIGSLTGALLAARRTRIRLRLLVGSTLGFGAAMIIAGAMPTYVSFAVFSPVIGFFAITMLNSANATMQIETLPELRGRVMALYMTIVMGGTPLGAPIVGWIGEQLGARWTMWFGGGLTMLGVLAAVAVYLHTMRRRELAFAQAAPEAEVGVELVR